MNKPLTFVAIDGMPKGFIYDAIGDYAIADEIYERVISNLIKSEVLASQWFPNGVSHTLESLRDRSSWNRIFDGGDVMYRACFNKISEWLKEQDLEVLRERLYALEVLES